MSRIAIAFAIQYAPRYKRAMESFTRLKLGKIRLPPPTEPSFKSRLSAGFTLVELATVLVIIGLIVGGIMVGQDLIKAARLRKAANQMEKLSASVNAFKLKYGCTPGDCPNALNFFPSSYVSGCTGNGDGNGLIDNWSCESTQAIAGLITAGLLSDTRTRNNGNNSTYFSVFNEIQAYLYYADLYTAGSRVGNNVSMATFSSPCVNGGAFLPKDAEDIDKKIDDGYPLTGAFLGLNAATATSACSTIANSCIAAGTNSYTTTVSMGCRTIYFLQ